MSSLDGMDLAKPPPVAFVTASFCAAALNGSSTNFMRAMFLEGLRCGKVLLTEEVRQELEACFEDVWPQIKENGYVCEEDTDDIFRTALRLSDVLADRIAGKEYATRAAIYIIAAARVRMLPIAAADEGYSSFSITALADAVGLEIIDMNDLMLLLQ